MNKKTDSVMFRQKKLLPICIYVCQVKTVLNLDKTSIDQVKVKATIKQIHRWEEVKQCRLQTCNRQSMAQKLQPPWNSESNVLSSKWSKLFMLHTVRRRRI